MAAKPADPQKPARSDAEADPATRAAPDPDEAQKARYREALAHKRGSSGARKAVHGDEGEAVHSQNAGPTQKMFRRKAGG